MRILAVLALAVSATAFAQPEAAPAPQSPEAQQPQAAPATPEAPPAGPEARLQREQIKREVMDEVQRALEKQRQELTDQVRAEVATQSARNAALEEEYEFQESRRRLELFELDGYFRVRPELFHNFDMGRGVDPNGFGLFVPDNNLTGNTFADANMRFRLEPTLNVSEEVRVHAQIDALDRVLMGVTPEGPSERTDFSVLSQAQLPASTGLNWINDSIQLRRVWGEVNTPLGQFLFGRQGTQWGTGMLYNSGNCLDCDYGDTVDRIAFVSTKVAGHYIVPFIDFVFEGLSSAQLDEQLGQPFDLAQTDDARDYGLVIAKRDTDLEITRKLAAGQHVLNYGLHFLYRTQRWDSLQTTDSAGAPALLFAFRDAKLYVPDVWVKFQTKKLRLELEVAGVFGSIDGTANVSNPEIAAPGSLDLRQLGAVAQGEYSVLSNLALSLEVGFASGDKAPGMGNKPGRDVTLAENNLAAGTIDGPQYCLACGSRDNGITNFRFNRDYRVDLILWREILDGVTDAVYVKPAIRFDVYEGLSLWANAVYSRAVYPESTPSSFREADGSLSGTSANLGLEFDGGIRYDSGDGFLTGISYGVLLPFDGLRNVAADANPSTAQAVRGWFVIQY